MVESALICGGIGVDLWGVISVLYKAIYRCISVIYSIKYDIFVYINYSMLYVSNHNINLYYLFKCI